MKAVKIAIIGEKSMIASQCCDWLENETKSQLIKADIKGEIKVDVTDKFSIDQFFQNYDFEYLILFSAFTDVSSAEKQRNDKNGWCWKINVDGTRNIVASCKKYQRSLIAFSTDFVFDGTSGPYSENDQTGLDINKVSWYGITKIEAEKIIQDKLSNFIILRISYPYSGKFVGKDDLVTKTIRLYRQGRLYPIYQDQIITPTYIPDIAPAIANLISKDYTGIFHLASPTTVSQYDFAKRLIELTGTKANIKKGLLAKDLQNKNSVPRPLDGGLKVNKILKTGIKPTDWQTGCKKSISNLSIDIR